VYAELNFCSFHEWKVNAGRAKEYIEEAELAF